MLFTKQSSIYERPTGCSSSGAATASKVLAFIEFVVYRGQSDRKHIEKYIFVNALEKNEAGPGACRDTGCCLGHGGQGASLGSVDLQKVHFCSLQ